MATLARMALHGLSLITLAACVQPPPDKRSGEPRAAPRVRPAPDTGDPAVAKPADPVIVNPPAPPQPHPLAPESLPNKPETIPEVVPGTAPPKRGP